MILLIDNYDSFTYNLAQYIGNFAEVKVLRNDDAGLYQAAEEADALVLSPGPGWPADTCGCPSHHRGRPTWYTLPWC